MGGIAIHNILRENWEKYNQVRVAGDKKAANKLLTEFISSLKKEDEKTIKSFVDEICELILDQNNEIIANNGIDVSTEHQRIQHPLFKEIILPILVSEYKKNSAKHMKWIGQLEQFFYSDDKATTLFLKEINVEGHLDASYFFEKSFALDANQNTLTLLLNKIAWNINYYVHEVPLGVLVEPEVLNKELAIFKKYWQQSNRKNLWEKHLEEWNTIAKHWTEYCATLELHESFESYLEKNGVQID